MSDFAVSTAPRATFGTRLAAAIIDAVIVGAVDLVFLAVLRPLAPIGSLVSLGYYTYLEGSPSGQTIGKRVMNIRVVDIETGGSIGYGRALVRWVGRIISGIACLVGYFWMLWDNEKQTWHDKMATSVVVPTSAYPVDEWPGSTR